MVALNFAWMQACSVRKRRARPSGSSAAYAGGVFLDKLDDGVCSFADTAGGLDHVRDEAQAAIAGLFVVFRKLFLLPLAGGVKGYVEWRDKVSPEVRGGLGRGLFGFETKGRACSGVIHDEIFTVVFRSRDPNITPLVVIRVDMRFQCCGARCVGVDEMCHVFDGGRVGRFAGITLDAAEGRVVRVGQVLQVRSARPLSASAVRDVFHGPKAEAEELL